MDALVNYNDAPVATGTLVGFAVFYPNATVAALNVDPTNSTGYASMEFRIPSSTSNSASSIGQWSIVASALVSSVVETDTVNFTCAEKPITVVSITGIQLPASVARSGTLKLNVTAQGLTSTLLLSVTILDAQQVPIACYTANVAPAKGGASTTVPVSISIPSWAYVGTATVYADLSDSAFPQPVEFPAVLKKLAPSKSHHKT